MSVGIFTDREQLPKARQVERTLGASCRRWKEFVSFVQDETGGRGEWKFYGKNHGWALRFRKGGKSLVSLYPGQESFAVQFILDEPTVRRARAATFGVRVLTAIDKATPYPEGRWVFLRITSEPSAQQARKLLLLKMKH